MVWEAASPFPRGVHDIGQGGANGVCYAPNAPKTVLTLNPTLDMGPRLLTHIRGYEIANKG